MLTCDVYVRLRYKTLMRKIPYFFKYIFLVSKFPFSKFYIQKIFISAKNIKIPPRGIKFWIALK